VIARTKRLSGHAHGSASSTSAACLCYIHSAAYMRLSAPLLSSLSSDALLSLSSLIDGYLGLHTSG
jgi:hypothetical protein